MLVNVYFSYGRTVETTPNKLKTKKQRGYNNISFTVITVMLKLKMVDLCITLFRG